MFLILSGEGASDIGIEDQAIGPMTKWVDLWIESKAGYSLIDIQSYAIIPKQKLVEKAKEIKPRSKRGKKSRGETRYFYKNARALALIAKQHYQHLHPEMHLIVVLFRDADGTASSDRGEWQDKWASILAGFKAEGLATGVPMLPKPKSEAWVLCALCNHYQHCAKLEEASGNDASPKSLKKQLEEHLQTSGTRELLNEKVDDGELDLQKIKDMSSLTAFTDRLDEVLA